VAGERKCACVFERALAGVHTLCTCARATRVQRLCCAHTHEACVTHGTHRLERGNVIGQRGQAVGGKPRAGRTGRSGTRGCRSTATEVHAHVSTGDAPAGEARGHFAALTPVQVPCTCNSLLPSCVAPVPASWHARNAQCAMLTSKCFGTAPPDGGASASSAADYRREAVAERSIPDQSLGFLCN